MDDWSAAISAANTLINTAEFAAGLAYQDYAQDKQNEYNLEMWNLQNEYNSPQAQMQRFQEAGLNPNLIYSQGTNGNNASAPQKQVPQQQHNLDKISKLFNVVNLASAYEGLRKQHYDAELEKINATREQRILQAELDFGTNWTYDYNKGTYVKRPLEFDADSNLILRPSAYYFNRILESNFNRGHLIPYRQAVLEQQKNYLVPQVQMANYESRYYPYSYWIGTGSKALQGVGSLVGLFNPKNWFMPLGKGRGSYIGPTGKVYHY